MPETMTFLDAILRPDAPAFALIHRPSSMGGEHVDILLGDVRSVDRLADLPLPEPSPDADNRQDLLVLVPYRQIAERGFAHHDDDAPLLAMTVHAHGRQELSELLSRLPDTPVDLRDGAFDIDDEAYTQLVHRILTDEIGRGEGSNFVVKRSFLATVANFSTRTALAVFRRLMAQELGAYWTFVVHTGDRTLIGATPERHVSVVDGTVVMNPISGTYRYPQNGPSVREVLRFLADRKETDELYMVVDEELKMMSRVCDSAPRVVGPYLKEMARLAHTEYLIEGDTGMDVRDVLRETMFAPTVTGSPLANAFRVISRYERRGRRYYGGIAALIGQDSGRRTLDSAILIRTAEIDGAGHIDIGVGATLVRHSQAEAEVAETRAKAAALLAALGGTATSPVRATGERLGARPEVRLALAARNLTLSRFWLDGGGADHIPRLADRRILVVDADDTFTAMLGHQLRSLGPAVAVRRFDEAWEPDGYDMVVMGPGPGDPRDVENPKIAALHEGTRRLLDGSVPFLAVCLGHQVLATVLGFELVRRTVPNQGVQREIDFFGRPVRVGFYNTFAARCVTDQVGAVQVSRDPATGEVHGLRGPNFRSVQFHPESVLTQDGPDILAGMLTALLPTAALVA